MILPHPDRRPTGLGLMAMFMPLLFLLAACGRGDQPIPDAVPDSAAVTMPGTQTADVRVEVDIAARLVRVIHLDGDTLMTHPVAVGSDEWPTRPGTWTIDQVVFNPEWIPPDESWAADREGKQPGDPQNPLGHAQIPYDLPRSIHGTNDPSSIGKAVSHGSIRVTNEVAVSLAQFLITRTNAGDAAGLAASAANDRTNKVVVNLPIPVPIRVF